jgi:hypothetical protein
MVDECGSSALLKHIPKSEADAIRIINRNA